MDSETHEKYEYARARIAQKKWLLYHFIFFALGSLLFFLSNTFLQLGGTIIWYSWVVTGWFFLLLLHFIKVYVVNRFMNKSWERAQIDRLILKQEQKIAGLSQEIAFDNQPQNT